MVAAADPPQYPKGARRPDDAARSDAAASRGWKPVVGSLAALFLGGVFLVAVWGKMLDPAAFAETVEVEGLDVTIPVLGWHVSAEFLALFALGLEAAIGLALVLNMRSRWVLVPTTLLVLFFMFLTTRAYVNYARGIEPEVASCGCFGHLVDRTPAQAFWQDLILLVPPLALAWLGRSRGPFPWWRIAAVLTVTVGVVVFAWAAPNLDLDDIATRLKPGVKASEICVGSGDEWCLTSLAVAPQLEEGTHIVILADLTEAFGESLGPNGRLEELLAWAGDYDNPRILILHAGKKEDEGAFKFRSGFPPVDLLPAPRELLRPLYRSLPRTFVVEDGRVTGTWSGFPRLSEVWSSP